MDLCAERGLYGIDVMYMLCDTGLGGCGWFGWWCGSFVCPRRYTLQLDVHNGEPRSPCPWSKCHFVVLGRPNVAQCDGPMWRYLPYWQVTFGPNFNAQKFQPRRRTFLKTIQPKLHNSKCEFELWPFTNGRTSEISLNLCALKCQMSLAYWSFQSVVFSLVTKVRD